MNKTPIVAVMLVLLCAGMYYFKRIEKCFGSTGALEIPTVKETLRGQPLALRFKMLRIAAPGCFTGSASESYKDVSCGYRIGDAGAWEKGQLSVVKDSATELIVECAIPPVSNDTAQGTKLDYYFQYSGWGNPPEKQSGSVVVK